jgi:LemA protein
MIGWIILGVIVVFIVAVIGMYNALVRLRNQVKNAWSQIDVQLKRRHDLIPNLVEAVKGYAKHEKETMENLTKARSAAVGAEGVAAKSKAEGELSGALDRFMLVVENYPDLKANQNFLALQEELSSTENKIAFARQTTMTRCFPLTTRSRCFLPTLLPGCLTSRPGNFLNWKTRPSVKCLKWIFPDVRIRSG